MADLFYTVLSHLSLSSDYSFFFLLLLLLPIPNNYSIWMSSLMIATTINHNVSSWNFLKELGNEIMFSLSYFTIL